MYLPWVEKYRPKEMKDICYQNQIINSLQNSIQNNNLSHVLFYGPAGTGKTSTIMALCNNLFGPKLINSRVYKLNASDDRGIDVIRNKIKMFARKQIMNCNDKEYTKKYPCPNYKIIILDEADSMTNDAQTALRMIMEKYYCKTRFCIICNYINKIINPILSRCSRFRFKRLNDEYIIGKLQYICDEEKIIIENNELQTLSTLSNGDLRKAITLLQSVNMLKDDDNKISIDDIIELSREVPDEIVIKMLKLCSVNKLDNLLTNIKQAYNMGYSVIKILTKIHILIINSDIDDIKKSDICIGISKVDNNICNGSDDYLQLMKIMTYIYKSGVSF